MDTEKTHKCYCVVIPFGVRQNAVEILKEIQTDTGFEGIVKELELTEKELSS